MTDSPKADSVPVKMRDGTVRYVTRRVAMWIKPNTTTGRFENAKREGGKFKGVRREN